jgi:putative exporter of polyketide antibiotics
MTYSGMWHRVDPLWTDASDGRQFTQELQGATSQKSIFLIINFSIWIRVLISSISQVLQFQQEDIEHSRPD